MMWSLLEKWKINSIALIRDHPSQLIPPTWPSHLTHPARGKGFSSLTSHSFSPTPVTISVPNLMSKIECFPSLKPLKLGFLSLDFSVYSESHWWNHTTGPPKPYIHTESHKYKEYPWHYWIRAPISNIWKLKSVFNILRDT